MKATPFAYLGLFLASVITLAAVKADETSGLTEPEEGVASSVTYEVALVNKSMTGDWRDERAFRKHVKATFRTSKILRFKFRGDPLLDWLDEEEPSVARVICLIDGWISPGMKRVDVRGSRDGEPLKFTIKVVDGKWKEALTQAKRYVEPSG
jgi:hypothetical protein